MYYNDESDERLRRDAERMRIAVGESYKYAIQAEAEGDHDRAASLRERAAWQTRKAELWERLIGRDIREMSRIKLTSMDVDAAMKLLDRFDTNPIGDVLSGAAQSEHAEGRFTMIQENACNWAFANAVRAEALDEIVRMIQVIESDGVEVNLAAMARMTGISRQTLHARLRGE
ncbi:hypothetical protein AB0E88_27530 [Streptomyces sp. NPDC028635]|uniref:hypothetical protein n=1 Tax=Streptomyces sp. NPDC028635 TaxID=3154800 RepID=UPI0033D7C9D4